MTTPTFNTPQTNPFGLSDVGSFAAPSFADLDADGDLDAFVGTNLGNTLFFENTGSSTTAAFATAVTNSFGLSDVGNTASPTLADIDGDGDLDAFVGNSEGNTLFFENIGSSTTAAFATAVTNSFGLSDVGFGASPAFADIDNDGDLDAFVGNNTGNILFFLNTGSSTSAAFAAAVTNSFGLSDVGTYASPTLADIDGDGDLDAFVGSNVGNTLFFQNTGSANSAAFATAVINSFGLSDVGSYASPTFANIDADGDLDAFVGNYAGDTLLFLNAPPPPAGIGIVQSGGNTAVTEGGATDSYTVVLDSQPTADVVITLNNTNGQVTTDLTTLTFTSANWNTAQTVTVTAHEDTVGEGAHRGVIGYSVSSTDTAYNNLAVAATQVAIADNDLPAGTPTFQTPQTNPFGLSDVGGYAKPTLVDIDGDGDLDALVGNYDGNTLFFQNTGSASSAAFATAVTNSFGLSDVGSLASPALADIDGDGDLDAFVGNRLGNTLFFQNTGSASSAVFTAAVTNSFGLGNVGSYASPTFADIDGDGDLDAFVGNYPGDTRFFENTGSATSAAFTAAVTDPYGLSNGGGYAAPTFADIDGDGDLDAFVGNKDGNTLLFLNGTPAGVSIAPSDGNTAVTEGGATDTYTVVLNTAPTADVVITLDNTNDQVSTDVATLTFTSANWNTAQTVTVTANNDTVGEGKHRGVIGYSVGSTDGAYNNLAVAGTQVAVIDNDLPTGTPTFNTPQTNPFGLSDVGSSASPTLADIDADGDLDVLVGNDAGSTLFFLNTGSATSAAFTTAVTNSFGLSDVGTMARPTFADLDGDGDLDAWVGNSDGNTLLFLNTGSATSAAFAAAVTDPYGLSDVGVLARPAFADLDGDGDLDALVGNDGGDTLFFLNGTPVGVSIAPSDGNTAVTEGGATDTYTVVLDSQPTADVVITLDNTNDQVSTDVATVTFTTANWETPQTVTVTANNDTVGEGAHRGVIGYSLSSTDGAYNNLAVANTQVAVTDNDLPTGTPTFNTPQTNPFGLSDAGTIATPALADIDGDGDLDALIGNLEGDILLFLNTGSTSSAAFAAAVTNSFGLSNVGSNASPTVADIDGDGDLDAWVGNSVGNTLLFLNTGSAGSAAFATAVTDPLGLSDVGTTACPTLADIDNDGDLDAFVGNRNGDMLFFQNTGSASSAAFAAAVSNPFGLSDVGSSSKPTFADLDGDGDLDALVGNKGGDTLFFQNTGSASSAGFAAAVTDPFGLGNVGLLANPALADIDGDGDLDAFVGNFAGDTLLFLNEAPTPPVFSSAAVNGITLVMTYTEATTLDANHGPVVGDFTVLVGGVAATVTAVAVNAALKTVTLTLGSAVAHGAVVTVAYTDPTGGNDANAIQDAAGNDAATLTAATVTNNTPAPAPAPGSTPTPTPEPTPTPTPTPEPTPTPTPAPSPAPTPVTSETVDGIVVTNTTQTTTTTITDPTTGTERTVTAQVVTTTVPIVPENRQEENQTTPQADIPLAQGSNGETVLQASLPPGVGLTSEAVTGGEHQTLRELLIAASQPRSDQNGFSGILGNGIDSYVPGVGDQNQVTVRTITFETTPNRTETFNAPIIINGASGTGEQDANNPDRQEALVIDVRNLPPGTVLQLHNVEFAIIIGASRITGGNGQNFAVGDNSAQFMVLGAEDDVLRGGGGDDTIGSKGGDDLIYGDEGNDLVVGGIGNDTLHGGDGDDILQGGASDAGSWTFALDNQGQMQLRFVPVDAEIADSTGSIFTRSWTMPVGYRDIHDNRAALIEQDYGSLADVALLFQAVVKHLPDVKASNHFAGLDLDGEGLAQIAYDYVVEQNPGLLQQPVADQVRAVITEVWGSASDELVRLGTDYINWSGNWAEGLLYLARHANNRDSLVNADGLLQLTTPLVVGESGWSANAGNDQLFGGAGNDLLLGGSGNNLLDGGEGLDMAAFVGVLADYAVSLQETAQGIIDVVLSNIHSGDSNSLRNIELARIGGDIYQAKAEVPTLAVGETKPLADFVQVVGVAELQALEVPTSWLA